MPSSTQNTKRKPKSTASAGRSRRPSARPSKPAGTPTTDPGSITNYTTALRWLYEHVDHERQRMVKYDQPTFNLDRMRKLLHLLGDPQGQLKIVHVAGTKGKGSTCAMITSMLQACGYTVGSYSSPHLVDLRERITINNHMVSYGDCAELFKTIASVEHKFGKTNQLTFFEIMTAAALLHFQQEAVDIVVLETGLGGRLDSTNVVTPLVTAITGLSLDHTQLLGKTLPEIAREKAGIFKPEVPALTIAQEKEADETLKQVAEEVGTTLEVTGKELDFSYRFEANRELGPHTRVCLTTDTSKFEHLPVPLKGEHQAQNCGLALAVLDKLKAHGFTLPLNQVIDGLAATKLPGRMETVLDQPRVIIDGAHNAASITALTKSLGAHVQYDSLVMIFGCGQDKDINGMLKQIALGADKIIFTRAKANPRAEEPDDLMRRFNDLSPKMAQTAPNLEAALKLAARAVSREDLIVVTGSFYLAGEARKYFIDAKAKQAKG
ncbi:MAG: folylpolyglutamate synthase/dihydrofolate synthase family protein [Planctomycetota bacterium]